MSPENKDQCTIQSMVIITLFVVSVTALYHIYKRWRSPFPGKAPTLVREGIDIIGPVRWWTKRWEFFNDQIQKHKYFSFYVGNNLMIGVSGDAARKAFLENKDLSLAHGSFLRFGHWPRKADKTASGKNLDAHFRMRLSQLSKASHFAKNLTSIVDGIKSTFNSLEINANSRIDPFDTIYELTYCLTMRTIGCNELADDKYLVKRMLTYTQYVENSGTPMSIIFPWFPWPALIKRYYSLAMIYITLKNIIEQRKKTGVASNDALQFMLDQGDEVTHVIATIEGSLVAGLSNTGINAAWVLIYLAHNPEWKEKVLAEIALAARNHCSDPNSTLVDQLTSLPIEIWETGFPIIDICLRESIRLQSNNMAMRQNISGKDIRIADILIPNGAFVGYHKADIHKDNDVYPNPDIWHPGRFLSEKMGSERPYTFIGWGAARHPCLGTRMAKLQVTIVTAFWLAMFQYELVDKFGKSTHHLPAINLNLYGAEKPKEKIYLKYKLNNQ